MGLWTQQIQRSLGPGAYTHWFFVIFDGAFLVVFSIKSSKQVAGLIDLAGWNGDPRSAVFPGTFPTLPAVTGHRCIAAD